MYSSSVGPASRKNVFSAIAEHLFPFVNEGKISGAVAAIASKDCVLHLEALGKSDLSSGRALETDDLFWIASMSKPITALAVALLSDDGRLAFDDSVEKHLPEFRGQWTVAEEPPDRLILIRSTRAITIRDLLRHTSGTGDYPVIDSHWTLGETSKIVAREPLRFQPGTQCSYSTAGVDVLGRIVEIASGRPFDQFLEERLFAPLGMTNTSFWVAPEQESRLVKSYGPNPHTGALQEAVIPFMYGSAVTDRTRPPLGGAGLFSTAEDIVRIYQMMLNDGKVGNRRILKSETLQEMIRKQTGELLARPGLPWGLGFCLIEDPSKMASHAALTSGTFGHGGAFGTNSWADPARGLIYVFMIQRAGLLPSPDDSEMHQAFQKAAALALAAP